MATAALGFVGAIAGALFVKNPRRGTFDPPLTQEEKEEKEAYESEMKAKKPKGFQNFLDGMKELNNDPVCNNVFWAGSIRSFGSAIVTAFIPVYFQQAFPECKSQFALVSALSLTILGFGSSLMGGILSDKFEKKSYMSKANIVIAGNILAHQ